MMGLQKLRMYYLLRHEDRVIYLYMFFPIYDDVLDIFEEDSLVRVIIFGYSRNQKKDENINIEFELLDRLHLLLDLLFHLNQI